MTFRWLEEDEILAEVNPALAVKGYPQLNTGCCRVMGAFDDDILIEFIAVQLFPMIGPMLRVNNETRDDGATSRELGRMMHNYLESEDARGALTIADHPVTARLCERYGMKKIDSPVFIWSGVVH